MNRVTSYYGWDFRLTNVERAAEWSRAPALANPSVMRVGSKLGSKPDVCCWNFGACYVLFTFINSGFTIIYLAVANTVVVTDTVTPNALLIVSACLRGIARKITFASKRLAMSQLQLLCSVLCSCILFFVFIINYSLIEFISFSYFLFL